MFDLKVDLDRDFGHYQDHITERETLRIVDVLSFFLVDVRDVDIRHSTKGLHIRIGISFKSAYRNAPTFIPFIQIALGSHYKRELWNYYRATGEYRKKPLYMWNVLFNYKHRLADNYKSVETPLCSICTNELLKYRIKVYHNWDDAVKKTPRFIMKLPDKEIKFEDISTKPLEVIPNAIL